MLLNAPSKVMRGVYGSGWAERQALQVARDTVIVNMVEYLEVVNHELLVALLGMDNTPSSLASIGRRMQRLAKANEFGLVTQFDFLLQQSVTYAVANDLKPGQQATQRQLPHKLLMSKFWVCAEQVLPITGKQTDRQLRGQGGLGSSGIIPDGLCILNNRAYPIECNRGRDHFKKVVEKSQRYHRHNDYLKTLLNVEGITVLWVSKLPGRVQHMAEAFATIGTGGMFRVCAEKDFTPFDPQTINSPIWMNPANKMKEVLYATENANVDDPSESGVDAAHLF